MPIYLSAEDVASIAPPISEVERCIFDLFRAQAEGMISPISRLEFGYSDTARFLAFPVAVAARGVAGIKWLGLPRGGYRGPCGKLSAVLLLNDVETGALEGIIDGEWITAVRTAAVSLIAAKHVANPQSRHVAFIGCGDQAELHFAMFLEAFPIDTVTASSRSVESVERFLGMAERHGVRGIPASSNRDCVEQADIVIATASSTSDRSQLCQFESLKKGCFVSHVDMGRSFDWRDDSGFRLVVDDVSQYCELVRSGNLCLPSYVPIALPALLSSTETFSEKDEPTAFLPTGWGVADVVLALMLVNAAKAAGKGLFLPQ